VIGVLAGLAWPFVAPARAQLVMDTQKLMFRLVGDEPIATGDGRQAIQGWRAVMLRDMHTDQCYIAFIMGGAMSTTGPVTCPAPTR
jgi:hypothetical protein